MGTKVKKSILKPLRYISFMFDSKEPEMQIGLPTDVKHVAHIGSDGPNVGAPGWMKDYHSAPLDSTSFSGGDRKESPVKNLWGSQELMRVEAPPSEPTGTTPSRARHARRHQSDGTTTTDPSEESSKRSRRLRKKEVTNGTDLSAQDLPAIPKQSHRRRPKGVAGASGGESTRSSRSKVSTTSATTDAICQESITKPQQQQQQQQQLDRNEEEEEDSE